MGNFNKYSSLSINPKNNKSKPFKINRKNTICLLTISRFVKR